MNIMEMRKRGIAIDKKILSILHQKEKSAFTKEISSLMDFSGHTIINHNLRFQLSEEIEGYEIDNLNAWFLSDKKGDKK